MKSFFRLRILLWIILLPAITISCTPGQSDTIPLASFNENDVDVSISLIHGSNGAYILSAAFTPPEGYHLYSKDIPINGVDGLGRPTLLELTPNSRLQAAGTLAENAKAGTPSFEPKELLVYPLGPMTLSLPVKLPQGDQWTEDQLSVTYMACSASQCKPPVVGKIVTVRVPGVDVVDIK